MEAIIETTLLPAARPLRCQGLHRSRPYARLRPALSAAKLVKAAANASDRRHSSACKRACRSSLSCSAAAAAHPEQDAEYTGNGAAAPMLLVLAAKLHTAMVGLAAACITTLQQAITTSTPAKQAAVKGAMKSFRMTSTLLPFAATGMGSTTFLMTKAVGSFMKTYLLLLFLRVLLSWFPAFNWDRQPWLTLRQMTDPYLQLFRGIIPPFMGMIDFTPLLGFFILQWLAGLLQGITMEDEIENYW